MQNTMMQKTEFSKMQDCSGFLQIRSHVIVVTWARGTCLICMPEAQGPQARGLRAYISGESRVPMLQVLCITSGNLKICLTYRFCFAYLYNNEYSF